MRNVFRWNGSFRRRSVFVALMAVAVLMVMVVPGSARVTHNESNSGFQVNADWNSGNDEFPINGNAGAADAGAWQVAWVNVDDNSECQGPDGVLDIRNVSYNINGYHNGDFPLDLVVAPTKGKNKLSTGVAVYTIEVDFNFQDDCANGGEGEGFGGNFLATVTVDLVGDGPVGKSRNSSSTVLPGENSHDITSETFRRATGTVHILIPDVFDMTYDMVEGRIAAVTWSNHSNSN